MVGSEIPQEKDVLQTALAVHDRASKVQASMDNPTPEMLEAYLNMLILKKSLSHYVICLKMKLEKQV